mmetsp:Transcript_127348/g.233675  ORF Transcript_127348/g.233675 Transcript_127348/m.233675 type:complete len:225 (+) Transcript_127348:317-991(+)
MQELDSGSTARLLDVSPLTRDVQVWLSGCFLTGRHTEARSDCQRNPNDESGSILQSTPMMLGKGGMHIHRRDLQQSSKRPLALNLPTTPLDPPPSRDCGHRIPASNHLVECLRSVCQVSHTSHQQVHMGFPQVQSLGLSKDCAYRRHLCLASPCKCVVIRPRSASWSCCNSFLCCSCLRYILGNLWSIPAGTTYMSPAHVALEDWDHGMFLRMIARFLYALEAK